MTGSTWLGQRLEFSRWTGLLALGDLIALVGFVAVGQARHTGTNPFVTPVDLLGALAPFLIGWLLVALIGGLWTHDALLGPRRMLSWTIPAWILGALIALALRATSLFPGNINGLFPVVALLIGGIVMIGWRAIASTIIPRPE